MISTRLATELDLKFLEECINKDFEINDNSLSLREWISSTLNTEDITLTNIKKYLNSKYWDQEIIIVNNGTKDIGFFSQDLDICNMVVGATCYVHPRACKMSILKMVRTCTVRGVLYGLKNDFYSVEFNTWAGIIVHTVKDILPSIKEYKIRDNYRICESSFDLIRNSINVDDIISRFDVSTYDSKNILFTMKDR